MNTEELENRFDNLYKKMYKLQIKYQTTQKELDSSLEENLHLKRENERQKEIIKNFQNQEKFNNIVVSLVEEVKDKEGLKRKLDEYILEIDKCITSFNGNTKI